MANACRVKHLAYRTEQAYVGWVKRFILFHNKRHPSEMGASEVRAFLTHLARRLVPSPAVLPAHIPVVEAELRRGVSTAYYALFHLLIHEATTRIVTDAALRARIGRSFDHGPMKRVCEEYSTANFVNGLWTVKSGAVIAPQLKDVGSAFVSLQEARIDADYNTVQLLGYAQAESHVTTAENAFQNWVACQADASCGVFLTELFLKSLPRR